MKTLRLLFALLLVSAAPSLARAQDATQDQGDDAEQTQPDQGSDQQSPADQSGDAQSETGAQPQPPAPGAADPVDVLQGLWHVDRAEGSAANDTMKGGILKIDRQAISSLSGGTCSSPSFAAAPGQSDPKQIGIDITCLGQTFASAYWNSDDPNTVNWTEPNLAVVLHRVTSSAAQ